VERMGGGSYSTSAATRIFHRVVFVLLCFRVFQSGNESQLPVSADFEAAEDAESGDTANRKNEYDENDETEIWARLGSSFIFGRLRDLFVERLASATLTIVLFLVALVTLRIKRNHAKG